MTKQHTKFPLRPPCRPIGTCILPEGFDEGDNRPVRLLKQAACLEQWLRFCVAVAQATDPMEMDSAPRVQRIVDAVAQCTGSLSVRVLVGARDNLVAAIFSDTRRASGWTAPQTSIAESVKERLLGLGQSVLVGLSSDQASPALIPGGLHEALTALESAASGSGSLPSTHCRCVDCCSIVAQTMRSQYYPAGLLTSRMRYEVAWSIVQDIARLQRIRDITTLNVQRYDDFSELILAIDCARL